MARTIGKRNILLIKELVREAKASGLAYHGDVEKYVIEKLPSEMWDTWEGADSEIRRIIWDYLFEAPLRGLGGTSMPKVGKKLMEWDEGEIIEGDVQDRIENWQDFYPEATEPPTEEQVREDVYQDTSLQQMHWDDEMDYLTTEILKEKNPEGYWHAEMTGFGWREQSGYKYFHATKGEDFLSEILPKTQCTFRIFNYGRGLAIQNFHHDSPTGKEWYYILPISSEKYSEAVS